MYMYTNLLIEKLHHVLDDVSHPLHNHRLTGLLIARSGRMRLPSPVTSGYLSIWLCSSSITMPIMKQVMYQFEM